jgi:protein-disulfide isomerase
MRTFLTTIAAIFLSLTMAAAAQEASTSSSTLSPGQQDQVKSIVRQYLIDHPEVIREAIEALQAREDQTKQQSQAEALKAHYDAMFNDPTAPIAGNPVGDVTIVEFFDYRCPYCKRVAGPLGDLLKSDPGIRLVFKEFPILSEDSVLAAQAALAANKQGKYLEFHQALMAHKGAYDAAVLRQIAISVGLDADRMTADMKDAAGKASIVANRDLADALQINSTPTFVIGNQIIAGAIPIDEMVELIKKARGS